MAVRGSSAAGWPCEYPGRDKPYIEDMGRPTRRIRLSGFLVSNSLVYGGDAKAQRDAMVDAVERLGPRVLIHPTLGELIVNVPGGGLWVIERWGIRRYFELSFIFIEYGQHIFPATAPSKVSLLDKLAKKLHLSAALGRLYERPETTDPAAYHSPDRLPVDPVPATGAVGPANQ